MRYLLQDWEAFSASVKAAAHVLLLSDYDGTLTPIVRRPELASLSDGIREKLSILARKPDFSVGIISGRPLAEIKTLVGIEGIYYAGNHGLEIEGPRLSYTNTTARASQAGMKELARRFSEELAGIRGVIVEDKGLSLSIHYRLVRKSQEKLVAELFHRIASPLQSEGKIRINPGKKVWEVRPPVDWDKGKAVETITNEIGKIVGGEAGVVIYLGDDITDEDAFKVIRQPQGWSIHIGAEKYLSSAGYFLKSTAEVETFLHRLAGLK